MKTIQEKSKIQLRLTILAGLFGDLGSSIFAFGLSFMLLERTGSVYSFALSAIISPIVGLILLPFIGPFVDRYSKKRIIIFSQLLSILGLLLYGGLFPNIQNQLLFFSVLLITLLKICDQFTSTARQAAAIRLVLKTELSLISAYSQVMSSIASIISAIFGALLFSLLPFHLFLLFELFCELLTLLLIANLDFNFQQPSAPDSIIKSTLASFKEGIVFLKKQKYLQYVLILALFINFFLGVYSVGLPILFLQIIKTTNLQFGIGEAINGLGLFCGGLLIKRKTVEYPIYHLFKKSLQLGLIIILMGSVTCIKQTTLALVILDNLLFLSGYFIVTLNVPYTVWLQNNLPTDFQGRIFSLLSSAGLAIMPLSILLFGFLFSSSSLAVPFIARIIFSLSGLSLIFCVLLITKKMGLPLKQARISIKKRSVT